MILSPTHKAWLQQDTIMLLCLPFFFLQVLRVEVIACGGSESVQSIVQSVSLVRQFIPSVQSVQYVCSFCQISAFILVSQFGLSVQSIQRGNGSQTPGAAGRVGYNTRKSMATEKKTHIIMQVVYISGFYCSSRQVSQSHSIGAGAPSDFFLSQCRCVQEMQKVHVFEYT